MYVSNYMDKKNKGIYESLKDVAHPKIRIQTSLN